MTAVRSLRLKAIDTLLFRAIGVIVLLLFHVVIGRTWGAEGYGIYSYAIAISGILLSVITLGMPSSIARYVAEYIENRKPSLLNGVIRYAYSVVTIASLFTSLGLVFFANYNYIDKEMRYGLILSALLIPVLGLLNLNRMILQGTGNVRASIIPEDIFIPAISIFIFLIYSSGNLVSIASIYFFILCCGLFLSAYWVRQSLPSETKERESRYKPRKWLLESLPLVASSIGQVILSRTDVIMIGSMLDMESAGIYSAASRISLLIVFVCTTINMAIAAMLASAYHGGRFDELSKLYKYGQFLSTIGAFPFLVGIILFPNLLMLIYGSTFTNGSSALQLLAIGQFAIAISGPAAKGLIMIGKQNLYSLPVIIGCILNVLGNYMLIPAFGVSGAAFVSSLSMCMIASMHYYFFRKETTRRNIHEGIQR